MNSEEPEISSSEDCQKFSQLVTEFYVFDIPRCGQKVWCWRDQSYIQKVARLESLKESVKRVMNTPGPRVWIWSNGLDILSICLRNLQLWTILSGPTSTSIEFPDGPCISVSHFAYGKCCFYYAWVVLRWTQACSAHAPGQSPSEWNVPDALSLCSRLMGLWSESIFESISIRQFASICCDSFRSGGSN